MQTEYNSNCSYLDVRLTLRSATSSGLVEICNEDGNWSVACSNVIDEDEASIICRQVGFNSGFTKQFTERILDEDERPRINEIPACIGDEISLLECKNRSSTQSEGRKRRGVNIGTERNNTCDLQAGLLCGGINLAENVTTKSKFTAIFLF